MNFSSLHIFLLGLAIMLRNITVILRENNSPEVLLLALVLDLLTGGLIIFVIYDVFLKNKSKKTQAKVEHQNESKVETQKTRDISKEIKRPKKINLYKPKKIKMDICSKNDLLSIDGFDNEKAEKFLQERNQGKFYYDIDTFIQDYELQPHQMIEVQDRLIFPPKPHKKMGRKIEF